jgi:high-affinity nickel-transport protein
MRSGRFDEAELEVQLNNRGFLNRILGGVTKTVRRPWHMFAVGLLFGLGFDTASEVALLVIAGGAAASALPWYAILVLPVLFAAGMSLFDSLDGAFMCFAYDWAFMKPVRKVFYNIAITSLSVAVALIIGMIELIGLLTDKLGIDSGPLAAIADLDLDYVGFGVVGLFVLTWLAALLIWRVGRIEQKWSAHLSAAPEAD